MNVLRLQRVEHNKKIYACPFDGCTSVFDRPYRLAQHRMVHANVKPFVCEETNCEKAYTSKSHLDRHIKTAHKETEVDLLYCCPKCMKKYVNRQNLKRHIKVSHTDNNKPFCCALSRIYFKKKHQLRAHMYVHSGVKPFKCPMCERDFITLYEKRKHMRNHKVYECEHCETKFTRWTELMQHKRVDHVSPEYICHDCGKVFKERGHIVRHVKKHLPNTPVNIFFCPYDNCCRHYTRNSNLKQHILVKHEGLTFDCSLCGAKLSTKAKLNEHIDRHNRPELPVKLHKTLETGRKKRKDAGTIRNETAMKLAGILKQKFEVGLSKIYTDTMKYQGNLKSGDTIASLYNRDEKLDDKPDHLIKIEKQTVFRKNVKNESGDSNQSVEVKVEANYSTNESTDLKYELDNTISEQSATSQHVHICNTSRKPIESVNFESKINTNKPVNLIEILNRPIIRIDQNEQAISSKLNNAGVQVKKEADTNIENTEAYSQPNESTDDLDKPGQSGTFITEVLIKIEEIK